MAKRLYRSRSNRVLLGVCGGLAEYFDLDPVLIRVITVLLVFANGVGILAYIILAIVVPLESSEVSTPREAIKENVAEMKETASRLGQEIRATLVEEEGVSKEVVKARHRNLNVLGIILIIVGILFLLARFNLLWWLRFTYLWPIIIIVVGLLVIVATRRK